MCTVYIWLMDLSSNLRKVLKFILWGVGYIIVRTYCTIRFCIFALSTVQSYCKIKENEKEPYISLNKAYEFKTEWRIFWHFYLHYIVLNYKRKTRLFLFFLFLQIVEKILYCSSISTKIQFRGNFEKFELLLQLNFLSSLPQN